MPVMSLHGRGSPAEPRVSSMRVVVRRNIDIHSDLTFGTGVTDAAEDPFDDVDVMLSAIQIHVD